MGRTVTPVRWEMEQELRELKHYLLSLRKEDKDHIALLYADVMKHVSSIMVANPLNPQELMQWSAILELEKKYARLQHELNRRFPP